MRPAFLAMPLSFLPLLSGQPLMYQDGAARLEGYLSKPEGAKGMTPGVVIIHQWMGLTDHERRTADELAKLGYTALAADIYGAGVHPANTQEASKLAGIYKDDRNLYQQRIRAALDVLKAQKGVDPDKMAVIGFCFGGTGALEAARGGLPVKGVVSFHGGLDSPADRPIRTITAKVLVCHGADDPFTSKDVPTFQDEMRKAKADYTFIAYAGAVHSFTQKEAGNDPSKGAAYQEAAAKRSWQHMKDFFNELFGQIPGMAQQAANSEAATTHS